MVYSKYGECFKKLRKQHNITLRAFEGIGISMATLSKFENGKTMLSLDKLDQALELMNVTMSAYSLMINNGQSNYFITQFIEIDRGYTFQNRRCLEKIYE